MDKVSTFTSTGEKLLWHWDKVRHFIDGLPSPISLQVAPTSRCNLKCSFCSNVNRKNHESLDTATLKEVINDLRAMGLRSIEWTGGGDPTLYEHINEMIQFCDVLGLDQGLITNGVELQKRITPESLLSLTWIRISMNCLNYVTDIDIPDFGGTIGFSYVLSGNENPASAIFRRIKEYALLYNAKYVRLVPNCQATTEEQNTNNERYPALAEELGEPFFYQKKEFNTPEKCYWCYIKPFILHDGYVYPCSSVVLNSDSDRHFNSKYRWCEMEKLPIQYLHGAEAFPTENCDHCVFYGQNKLLMTLRNRTGHENFV